MGSSGLDGGRLIACDGPGGQSEAMKLGSEAELREWRGVPNQNALCADYPAPLGSVGLEQPCPGIKELK